MTFRRNALLAAIAAFLFLVTGCDQSSTISGRVTYDGQPVKKGCITFLPDGGAGPSCGAPIAEGRYQAKCQPGKMIVQIVGVKAINYSRNSEDRARLAKEAAQRGDTTGIIDRADTIPADAEGNNAKIEIKSGNQTMDFDLKRKK